MEPILTNLNTNSLDKIRANSCLKRSSCNSPSLIVNKIPSFMMHSRSPSPSESIIVNNGIQTPKPNQVGSVILYGVPIVSLFIESQERLCLAQISNTLLKQFSYNEIHNRRVALGITCVQCTPVQLEILRRANAMPVSSRRCGMITRREAERLCKSFLGDNSPPRLPDDFAFSVHHECAWGCRGSFLPSRYNSSRAKCIKCSYCGLFFSPNKFIFHSHRISANDKYVQPDAANFNSWRRHLKLSGTPLDEIIHAWEDVKAMFNGGTRKRIISSSSSPSSRDLSTRRSQPLAPSSPSIPLKKAKESPNVSASSTPSSTSTTTNVQSPQYPMRPLNYSATNPPPTTTAATPTIVNSTPPVLHINPPPLRAPSSSFPQELPFSLSARSFMIDYMWHHQQQQQQQSSTSINAPTVANKASNHFQFAPYSALNWIKQPPQSFLFKPNGINEEKSSPNFNHFHSAFKPVINSMRLSGGDEPITTNSIQSPASSTSSSNYNQTTCHSDDEQAPQTQLTASQKRGSMKCKSGRQLKRKEMDFYIDVDERVENGLDEEICSDDDDECGGGESEHSKNQMTSDDENEVVDIETTEDDVQILNLQPAIAVHKRHPIDDEISGDEKNNNLEHYEARSKSPIKSLKEIVVGNDEFFNTKRNRLQSTTYEWSQQQGLNLKKESNKHESSNNQNYVHKVHGVTKLETRNDIESPQIPTKSSGELWSVAKLSLECNNNNNNSDDPRNSFYQHLNQIQQRNFNQIHHHHHQHHHQIDMKNSTSSHT